MISPDETVVAMPAALRALAQQLDTALDGTELRRAAAAEAALAESRQHVQRLEDLRDELFRQLRVLQRLQGWDQDRPVCTNNGTSPRHPRGGIGCKLEPVADDPKAWLGRLVRETWVAWATRQPDAKPSWLVGWDELDPGQREVDILIGALLFSMGVAVGRTDDAEAFVDQLAAAR